jgi:hypothetical protein
VNPLEPLLLGFSSGLVCTVSCGAVLLPFLMARSRGVGGTASLLGQFLAGRLAGYLVFATLAWGAGVALASGAGTPVVAFGAADLALGLMLGWYALRAGRRADGCGDPAGRPRAARVAARAGRLGPALIGLWSGVNLCPPFVAASVRAAETPGLPSSLAFFSLFFVGTTVWFLPFLGAVPLRRFRGAVPAARAAMAVVALYYVYRGAVILVGRWLA